MAKIKYPQLQDKKWLEEKYIKEKLSTTQISNFIGSSPSSVFDALKKHGIKTRSESIACSICNRKNKNKLLNNPAWLRKQYIENLNY